MKLRNKKTGKLIDINLSANMLDEDYITEYDSLEEFNEDWEDYEEPKKGWYLDSYGKPIEIVFGGDDFKQALEAVGNYFLSREEAEKAVEKLKAWKRLKDKGYYFKKWKHEKLHINVELRVEEYDFLNEDVVNDLNLLFGGEE